MFRSAGATSAVRGNSTAWAAFQARMSNRSVTTVAGIGFSPSRMTWTCGRSDGLA